MESKFDKLFNDIIAEAAEAAEKIKYIKYSDNAPPIKLEDSYIKTVIYNSFIIKDLLKNKRYFRGSFYSPTLKAWIVEQKLEDVYPKLLSLMKHYHLITTVNSNNAKFTVNSKLQNYSITANTIKQQFGKFSKYLTLIGTNDNTTFTLNSNRLINDLFNKLQFCEVNYDKLPDNLIINFTGTIVNNNFNDTILVNNVTINNQQQIINKINQYKNSLSDKKFLIEVKNPSVHNKFVKEIVIAKTASQAKSFIYDKYPKGLVITIKEVN